MTVHELVRKLIMVRDQTLPVRLETYIGESEAANKVYEFRSITGEGFVTISSDDTDWFKEEEDEAKTLQQCDHLPGGRDEDM